MSKVFLQKFYNFLQTQGETNKVEEYSIVVHVFLYFYKQVQFGKQARLCLAHHHFETRNMLIEKKTCILRYVYRPPRNIVHDRKLHTLQRGFTLALLRYLQARIIENTLYFF